MFFGEISEIYTNKKKTLFRKPNTQILLLLPFWCLKKADWYGWPSIHSVFFRGHTHILPWGEPLNQWKILSSGTASQMSGSLLTTR